MTGESKILIVMILGALSATGALVMKIMPYYRASLGRHDTRETIQAVMQLVVAEVGIQSFWVAAILVPDALRDPPGWIRWLILTGFVGTTWAPVVVLYRLYGKLFGQNGAK